MMIDTPKRKLDEKREIKVKIPVHTHLRLHSLKILEGRAISDTVQAALDLYFRDGEDA